MPNRALRHFNEDIDRAVALVELAESLPSGTPGQRLLRGDVRRSALMFTVGAMDAYFSDAYADLLSGTIMSIQRQAARPTCTPECKKALDKIQTTPLPVSMFMRDYPTRENWRWRMGARGRIERQNFLSLESEVQKLLNTFHRRKHGLFTADSLDSWLSASGNRKSLFGVTQAEYLAMSPQLKGKARADARDRMLDRIGEIVQRRHDCIHNCDRPDNAPQNIGSTGSIKRVINHVSFVVRRSDAHINKEFPLFLKDAGFSGVTINALGY
jgi:hypothetical protein